MPLTAKGQEILSALKSEYGPDKGEEVFYAGKNSGKFTGVDAVADEALPPIRAAGIMFICGETALFVQRSSAGDHAGEWCIPGGKIEEGETALSAAKRECREELGRMPKGTPVLHSRRISTGSFPVIGEPTDANVPPQPIEPPVDFTTFVLRVKDQFEPDLNEEHVGHAWAPISNPPQPIHPGLASALAKFSMTEYDVATAIVAGELTSPQQFMNVSLFDMRITGTGTTWRPKDEQVVYRPPENYLHQGFVNRCNGLPVIWKHPVDSILNSKEFGDRVVGSIILPYIKGDEVWGIARIYDADAIAAMNKEQLSTSPAVVFVKGDGNKTYEQDGMSILIEGTPRLLDHLAICKEGVWDKGGLPAGITVVGDSTMADEEKKEDATKADATKADATKADAATADSKKADGAKADEFPDKMLSALDSVTKMCDSIGKRMDSIEERMSKNDAAKADAAKADEKKEEDKKEDKKEDSTKADGKKADGKDEAKETAADAKKADEKDEEKMDAKADSADFDRRVAAAVEAAIKGKLPPVLSHADEDKFAAIQAKADSVYQQFGQRAPRHLPGESIRAYERRLAMPMQKHSQKWGGADLTLIADDTSFGIAIDSIYADAAHAARNPTDIPSNALRRIETTDTAGRVIVSYHGRPSAWMSAFGVGRRRASFIERDKRRA